jgi:hypothetical protein
MNMPCKLRLEHPGAIYHVLSLANGKGNVFEKYMVTQCRPPGKFRLVTAYLPVAMHCPQKNGPRRIGDTQNK